MDLRRESSKGHHSNASPLEASREGLCAAVVVANLGALFTAELVRVAMRLPRHWDQTDTFTLDRNLLPA
jgi:hypothetical protein